MAMFYIEIQMLRHRIYKTRNRSFCRFARIHDMNKFIYLIRMTNKQIFLRHRKTNLQRENWMVIWLLHLNKGRAIFLYQRHLSSFIVPSHIITKSLFEFSLSIQYSKTRPNRIDKWF